MSESFDEFVDDIDINLSDYENGDIDRETLIQAIVDDAEEIVQFKDGGKV